MQGLSPLSSSSSPRSDFLLACPFLSFVGYLLLEGTRVLLNELPFKTFVSTKQVEKKKQNKQTQNAAKMKVGILKMRTNIHQEQQTNIKGDFKVPIKPAISEETLVTDRVLFSRGLNTPMSN